MKFLYLSSSRPEDPTRAALPLHMASGAAEAGHTVEIVFQGEAAFLFNETVTANVHPVGLPSVKDLLAFVRESRISVFG
jgi:predicted peroxiredoxin